MWVFDSIVVARLTSNDIRFFEKPLIEGFSEYALTLDLGSFNVTLNKSYETVEFGRNDENSTQVYLFGVDQGAVYRYTFDLQLD